MSKLLKSSGIFALLTFLSRILGLVRDVVIANYFSVAHTDVFFTALRIPNTLRRFFAEGGFANAFVPVLNEAKETQSQHELQSLINHVFGVLGCFLLIITFFGVIFSGSIIAIIGFGFTEDAAQAHLGSVMLSITFPYILFISLTAFFAGILNTHQKFALPAFTPALLNISIIIGALVFRDFFDPPVLVLAWSVFIGGLMQFAIQIPTLYKLKLVPKPKVSLAHRGVRKILTLMVPTLLGSSAGQINVLLNTALASSLASGSITWLYYSDRLVELPIALIGVALGIVILPRLSALSANGDEYQFKHTLTWAFNLAFLVGTAATTGLMVLAFPLMMTLLQRGEFAEYSAQMAANSLSVFAVGGLFWVVIKVFAPAFYSQQNTKTPAYVAITCIGVNIVIALCLFQPMGHVGLATAASVSAAVNAIALGVILYRKQILLIDAKTLLMVAKVLAANLIMGSALYALEKYLTFGYEWIKLTQLQRVKILFMLICFGIVIYATTLLALKIRLKELLKPHD